MSGTSPFDRGNCGRKANASHKTLESTSKGPESTAGQCETAEEKNDPEDVSSLKIAQQNSSGISSRKMSGPQPKQGLYLYQLIALALKNSSTGRLSCAAISAFISKNFALFKSANLENLINTNLNRGNRFVKTPTEGRVQWTIAPDMVDEIDKDILEKVDKSSQIIRKLMNCPENLTKIIEGQMKVDVDTITKPHFNVSKMIRKAIEERGGSLLKKDIHSYVEKHYPNYTNYRSDWKGLISNCLSQNYKFTRSEGKYWSIAASNTDINVEQPMKKLPSGHLVKMIKDAFKHHQTDSLNRSEILIYISEHHSEYANTHVNWKNNISSVLRTSATFIKVENENPKSLWTINPEMVNKMDSDLQSISQIKQRKIRLSLRNPDDFLALLQGKLKYGGKKDKEKVSPQLNLRWVDPQLKLMSTPVTPDYSLKPPYKYHHLITLAFKNNAMRHLSDHDLFDFIKKHFPYFEKVSQHDFKGNLRQALKNNKGFISSLTNKKKNYRLNLGCRWKLNTGMATETDQEAEQEEVEEQDGLQDIPNIEIEGERGLIPDSIKTMLLEPKKKRTGGEVVEFDDRVDSIKQEPCDEDIPGFVVEGTMIKSEITIDEFSPFPHIMIPVEPLNEVNRVARSTKRMRSQEDLENYPVLKLPMLTIWHVKKIKEELKDADEWIATQDG